MESKVLMGKISHEPIEVHENVGGDIVIEWESEREWLTKKWVSIALNSHEDLLEACKLAQVRLMMLDGNNNDAYKALGKAIAKAEGRA